MAEYGNSGHVRRQCNGDAGIHEHWRCTSKTYKMVICWSETLPASTQPSHPYRRRYHIDTTASNQSWSWQSFGLFEMKHILR